MKRGKNCNLTAGILEIIFASLFIIAGFSLMKTTSHYAFILISITAQEEMNKVFGMMTYILM